MSDFGFQGVGSKISENRGEVNGAVIKKTIISIAFMFVFLAAAAAAMAAVGGDIQITCEPDVRIWVNGELRGKTAADENGLYLENLQPGFYRIEAVKSGYLKEEKNVEVQRGKTIEVKFQFTAPAMKIEKLTNEGQSGYTPGGVGNFILRSAPLRATVYFDGKEIGVSDAPISVTNTTAGKHRLKFVFKNQVLEGDYFLAPNQTMKLKANFMTGKIVNELEQEYVNRIGMKFVYIPAGSIEGAGERRKDDSVDDFYMQTTEVTQGQWNAIMDKNPSHFKKCGDDCPVENVSWNEAQEFIGRLNEQEGFDKYRLPTPAEWEYACNGGKGSRFGYGDGEGALGDYAWYRANAKQKTHPVAKKKANQWGLYDLHGNVMEWCRDFYAAFEPVAKGGNYLDDPKFLSCQTQEIASIVLSRPTIGFRLAMKP